MDARAVGGVLATVALALASGCGWEGFAPKDRELAPCHPACLDAAQVALPSPDATTDAEVPADAGVRDAETAPDAHPEPDGGDAAVAPDALTLAVLESTQATPNTVVFAWDPELLSRDLTGYELRLSADRGVLEAGGGELWGPTEDCALDGRASSRGGLVRSTRVLDLSPASRVYGRLYARVGGNPVAVADGVAETPTVRTNRLVLFADTLELPARREGFMGPEGAAEVHDGTGALWLPPGSDAIGVITALERAIPGELTARWATAYLELFMRTAPATTVCEIRVGVQGVNATRFFHTHLAVPGHAGWYRIQVPLSAFVAPGDVVMSSGGLDGVVQTIAIDATWPSGATVFFDDVAILY